MNVRVEPAELTGYAGLLDRNGGHADKIKAYVDNFDDLGDGGQGLLGQFIPIHRRARGAVDQAVTDLGSALRGSGAELRTAAAWYDRADETARERLDQINRAVLARATTPLVAYRAGGYRDRANPEGQLSGPTAIDLEADLSTKVNELLDSFDPVSYIYNFIDQLTGRNIPQELGEFLAGDWEAWARSASVWRQVGAAVAAVGDNVASGNAEMDRGWDGSAADVAATYFDNLARLTRGLKEPLEKLASAYEAAARAVYQLVMVIGDLCKMLTYKAAEALAALCRFKAGVGFFEVWEAVEIVKLVGRFANLMLGARATVSALYAAVGLVVGHLNQFRGSLPSASLDLRGV